MNWVEVAWITMIAASLTLGVVHLFVWQKQRSQYADLLFFVLAISAAAYGAFELAIMRAQTSASLDVIVRWAHVPLAVVDLSILRFIRVYFEASTLCSASPAAAFRLHATP